MTKRILQPSDSIVREALRVQIICLVFSDLLWTLLQGQFQGTSFFLFNLGLWISLVEQDTLV